MLALIYSADDDAVTERSKRMPYNMTIILPANSRESSDGIVCFV